jgi:hypothetical protein
MATLNESMIPSEETASKKIINDANKEFSCQDALGRIIKLKKPNIVAQYRFVAAMGDALDNTRFYAMSFPVLFVKSIDDVPVTMPTSQAEFYGILDRLKEEGVAAVMKCIEENFMPQDESEAKNNLKK